MADEFQPLTDEFVRLHLKMRERIAYMETSNRRNSLIMVVAFIGLAANTILSIANAGTVRGETFGLFAAGFGMVTALLALAPGPPIAPTDFGTDDPFAMRLYRTSRRFYYLSFALVAFWLGMVAWRAVSLWWLR